MLCGRIHKLTKNFKENVPPHPRSAQNPHYIYCSGIVMAGRSCRKVLRAGRPRFWAGEGGRLTPHDPAVALRFERHIQSRIPGCSGGIALEAVLEIRQLGRSPRIEFFLKAVVASLVHIGRNRPFSNPKPRDERRDPYWRRPLAGQQIIITCNAGHLQWALSKLRVGGKNIIIRAIMVRHSSDRGVETEASADDCGVSTPMGRPAGGERDVVHPASRRLRKRSGNAGEHGNRGVRGSAAADHGAGAMMARCRSAPLIYLTPLSAKLLARWRFPDGARTELSGYNDERDDGGGPDGRDDGYWSA